MRRRPPRRLETAVSEKPTFPPDHRIFAVMGIGKMRTRDVADRLRNGVPFYEVETSWVLRQLKRLERAGKVERLEGGYRSDAYWRVVDSGGVPGK